MGERRYKCIYCSKYFTKPDMVVHIEKEHMDEIPEGFTPLQVTFHIVNRKDLSYRRPCRICKEPTDWDEKKGRYNMLCNKQSCHDAYVKKMRDDMGDNIGKNNPTLDPEGQKKMLANRKISGKYTFQDGTVFTYTGSYEKKALEFMDQVLEIKGCELMVPGPVMYYVLDGDRRAYIPDMLYIPYNLLIEIKDGGNNPNTNESLSETRKKQIAKEKFVIEETNYNYIRLTNNNFAQLLSVFASIKMTLVDNTNERVIHVNENMMGAIQGCIPPASSNDVIIVNYMQNNVFSRLNDKGFGFTTVDDIKFDSVFTIGKDCRPIKMTKEEIDGCELESFIIRNKKSNLINILTEANNDVDYTLTESEFYESVVGHKLYSLDQIKFETCNEKYISTIDITRGIRTNILEGCKNG